MPRLIDLTNKRFIRLLVIKRVENDKRGNACWLCRCDCGNYKTASGIHLRGRDITSCGCFWREQHRTHGMYRTIEYTAYYGMKNRCCNPNHPQYKDYGGRGIKVCDRWLTSFEAFFKDMGKRPGSDHTIERINNDGNYELDNCKWATMLEQNNNTRKNAQFKAISPIGRVYTSKNQSEFARQFNLWSTGINICLNNRQRVHKGWTFEFLGAR